jgi:hypothetical protein
VHFPTDINLLWDAIRKAIQTCATLCDTLNLTEWRQSAYHLRCFKKSYRLIQKLKHSTSQDEAKKQARSLPLIKPTSTKPKSMCNGHAPPGNGCITTTA